MTAARRQSVRALADLAKAGYTSLYHPFTEVDFEVHHIDSRTAHLMDLLAGGRSPSKDAHSSFAETLSSSANGASLVIGTRTGNVPDRLKVRSQGSTAEPALEFRNTDDYRFRFRGSARPNLTFLAESSRRFEGLVAIEDQTGPVRFSHGIEIKRLIEKISTIAVDINAPLLSVQCPVQLPIGPKAETREDQIPRSSSLAVRFAIALRTPSAKKMFQLAERITRYCADHGFLLWLADTRLGYRTGNWFSVLSPKKAHKRIQDSVDEPGQEINTILPVTFVGPARVGSTRALISFLNQFPSVGVVGCSLTLLDDLAFIHFQLGLHDSVSSADLPHQYSDGLDPTDVLTEVLAAVAGPPPVKPDITVRGQVLERAGDYQTLLGPAMPAQWSRPERRLAIWFSWQMERTEHGIEVPMRALRKALGRIGLVPTLKSGADVLLDPAAPHIEYLICRDLGNSILRGKGKLSIPLATAQHRFPTTSAESGPSKLCVALEDAWKAVLDDKESKSRRPGPATVNVREVTIAWREYWLGHWAATLM